MQVEVSKHTEGFKDKMVRPNGLPESLIRYDGIIASFSFFVAFMISFGTPRFKSLEPSNLI